MAVAVQQPLGQVLAAAYLLNTSGGADSPCGALKRRLGEDVAQAIHGCNGRCRMNRRNEAVVICSYARRSACPAGHIVGDGAS